jgi:hypothetical protein
MYPIIKQTSPTMCSSFLNSAILRNPQNIFFHVSQLYKVTAVDTAEWN